MGTALVLSVDRESGSEPGVVKTSFPHSAVVPPWAAGVLILAPSCAGHLRVAAAWVYGSAPRFHNPAEQYGSTYPVLGAQS